MSNEVPISGFCLPDFYEVEEIFKRNMSQGDPSCGHEVGACVSIVIEGETVVDLWGGYKDAARTLIWEKNTILFSQLTFCSKTNLKVLKK